MDGLPYIITFTANLKIMFPLLWCSQKHVQSQKGRAPQMDGLPFRDMSGYRASIRIY